MLGALLVLPQGIAFAQLAGLPPQYGLYTAVIPCIVAALFGSSRHVVSGLGIAGALTIVALGQDISIAKAIALRSGQPIDASREFAGQGLANVAGSFFSSYVACGSLNRSLPNYEAGARTPLAAVCAAILLVVLVFFYARMNPEACKTCTAHAFEECAAIAGDEAAQPGR